MSHSQSFRSNFISALKGILAKSLAYFLCAAVGLTGGGVVGHGVGHRAGYDEGEEKARREADKRIMDVAEKMHTVLDLVKEFVPVPQGDMVCQAIRDLVYVSLGLKVPGGPLQNETGSEPPRADKAGPNAGAGVFLRVLGIGVAHAESVSDEERLKQVLDSMRRRYGDLAKYRAQLSVGENHKGEVEERPSPEMRDPRYARAVRAAIDAENKDRTELYAIRARQLGKNQAEVAATYAKIWQAQARRGEWIEVPADRRGDTWLWKQKE